MDLGDELICLDSCHIVSILGVHWACHNKTLSCHSKKRTLNLLCTDSHLCAPQHWSNKLKLDRKWKLWNTNLTIWTKTWKKVRCQTWSLRCIKFRCNRLGVATSCYVMSKEIIHKNSTPGVKLTKAL